MISMLIAACAIWFSFWQLMSVCLDPRLDWNVSPLVLLFLFSISARRKWLA